ncbi:MAG: GIY-YIG nuclease family protein [Patescibacteria group bacterium]
MIEGSNPSVPAKPMLREPCRYRFACPKRFACAMRAGILVPEPFDKLMALRQNANMSWFVYILLCDQKTFYVGSTDNLERRLYQHQAKQSFYTKKFSDIKLVYQEMLNFCNS